MQFRGIKLSLFALALSLLATATGVSASQEPAFRVAGYEVVGDPHPLSEDEIAELLAPFTGEKKTIVDLQGASEALEQAIKKAGFSFYGVNLPPQEPRDGIIKLQVIAFKLGKLKIKEGQYFDSENISNSLPSLVPGESPDVLKLQRNLHVLNEHPSKQTAVAFSPSLEKIGAIDAEIQVAETRPYQAYFSLQNNGSRETGHERVSAGFQYNNLFNLDHAVTLSYTTSPGHWGQVKQEAIFYRIPLYDFGGSLNAYYLESTTDSGIIEGFEVSGSGRFSGLHYTHALERYKGIKHSLMVGIDDKFFISDTTFVAFAQPVGVDVRSQPLSLNYIGEWTNNDNLDLNFSVGYRHNTGGGSDNDSKTYLATRAGADTSWDAMTYSLKAVHTLANKWELHGNLSGQWTDEPLIPGEQFGVGGSQSVRGFKDRIVSGDEGVRANAELWTPVLHNNLRLFGFVDAGYVSLEEDIPGTDDSETISSIGLGMRWAWKNQLSVALDWGYVTDGSDSTDSGENRLHVNLFYRM
jgi:hemolysin activation/secretion protein